MKVYVIIAAYKAQEFIKECISSIPKEVPILLGIDGCQKTLETVKRLMADHPNLQVYWYPANAGTYITFNSLLAHVPDNAAFITFGADDIMFPDMVERMVSAYPSKSVHDGVICLSKQQMKRVGGFSAWRVGSDSDLLMRLARVGIRPTNLPYMYHYRQHDGQLTKQKETGMQSEARLDIIRQMEESTATLIKPVKHAVEERISDMSTVPSGPPIQGVISASIDSFAARIVTLYNISDYQDADAPLVLFGMHRAENYMLYQLHRGPITVVWCGSDAMDISSERLVVLRSRKADHISTSSFITADLHKLGIAHRVVNMSMAHRVSAPRKLGNSIYAYGGTDGNFYGEDMWDEIEQRTGLTLIRANHATYTEKELQTIYGKCFIGLRLTAHDGLPTTAAELGLMGRKTIFNGICPHAIPWSSVDDICHSIMSEYRARKTADVHKVAEDWLRFISIGNTWMLSSDDQTLATAEPVIDRPTDPLYKRHQQTHAKKTGNTANHTHVKPKAVSAPPPVASAPPPKLIGKHASTHVLLMLKNEQAELVQFATLEDGSEKVTLVHGNHYARKQHGDWWQLAFNSARNHPASCYAFLPDTHAWDAKALNEAVGQMLASGIWALNPINDGRSAVWWPFTPVAVPFTDGIQRINYFDKAIVIGHAAMERLGWQMPPVPSTWHVKGASDGIGRHLSEKLNKLNIPIYRPTTSLILTA